MSSAPYIGSGTTELVEAYVDDWNALWTYALKQSGVAAFDCNGVDAGQVHDQYPNSRSGPRGAGIRSVE